jgi:Fur family transcriptional regulator, ferric uptake regulator
MSQRVQRLRDAGYKLTNARKAVVQALEEGGGHMTSTEIIDAVARIDPGIGRASVFRTLELLTSLTMIRPTYIDSSMTPTYVMLPEGHHHHIVCTQCHRVIEFNDCGLSELISRLESEYDMQLTGHLLELFGLCADCRECVPSPGSPASA